MTFCEQCGEGFFCGACSNRLPCWCFDLPPVYDLVVRDTTSFCICKKCLKKRFLQYKLDTISRILNYGATV